MNITDRLKTIAVWLTLSLVIGLGVIVVLASLIKPIHAAPPPAPVGTTFTFTLENGLQVVVIEDHRVPVVTHMVWYRIGSIDDPQGASGLAHLLEHLMFKSFDAASDETFAQKISALGAIDNARTSHDSTYYFQRVAREGLKNVMALEAKRMSGLELTKEQVEIERDVVREERRSVVESAPIKLLTEQLMATLHHNHSYGRPPIGWSHEITTLALDDALKAYRDFYVPSNAIVVIAGAVTPDEAQALSKDTYGKISVDRSAPERISATEPLPIASRRLQIQDRRVAQSSMFRYYLAPSYASAKPGEAEAVEILMQILGTGSTSRLYRALVAGEKKALTVGSRFFSEGRDSGRIAVLAVVPRGGDLRDVEGRVDDVINELVKNGIEEAELRSAKARIEARTIIDSDDQMKLAVRYGEALVAGLTTADVAERLSRIKAIRRKQVEDVARRLLRRERSVTGVLVPETKQ
ncbi:MAG: pitrilysin family protein [Pseudomonadota bacterium]